MSKRCSIQQRCKRITVDQSKVLRNQLFRFYWATRYSRFPLLYNMGHILAEMPELTCPAVSCISMVTSLLSIRVLYRHRYSGGGKKSEHKIDSLIEHQTFKRYTLVWHILQALYRVSQ